MPKEIDKKAVVRLIGAAVGGILGIVVAFTFGFAKPETVPRPIHNRGIGGPSYENVPTGYGREAFFAASLAAVIFGAAGWVVGEEAGRSLYP